MILLTEIFEAFIEPVRLFLIAIGRKDLEPFAGVISLLIYGIILYTAKKITDLTSYFLKKKKTIKTSIDLHPKFSDDEIKEYTENYISSDFQISSTSNDIIRRKGTTESDSNKKIKDNEDTEYDSVILGNNKRYNVIDFFLSNSFQKESLRSKISEKLIKIIFNRRRFKTDITELASRRYFFILGDTGMGKTAFMLNLFLKYAKKIRRDYEIEIFPLTTDNIESKIENISNKKNTILLLDALDEDTKAFPAVHKRIAEIASLTRDFRKILITCRTQFFTDEKHEPFEIELKKHSDIGVHQFGKLFISPFSDKQIRQFLRRKYRNKKEFLHALKILSEIRDVAIRPMVLKHLDDFMTGKRSLNYKIDIYELIVDKWIDREKYNISVHKRHDFKNNILKFSKHIAKHIYENPINNELIILSEEIDDFAKSYDISIDSLELKSRSLLNRGEKNKYKFSHKSILEYFLSFYLYENPSFLKKFKKTEFDAAFSFYKERCIKNNTIPFFRNLTNQNLDDLTPDAKAIAIQDIITQTSIPKTKLDIIIWRENKTKNYRFDWSLLKEIEPFEIDKSIYTDYEKILTGILN